MNDAAQFIQNCPIWWNPGTVPEQVLKAGKTAIMEKMKVGLAGALVFGGAGLGKTSAALCVGYDQGKEGHYVRFQDFQELMVKVRSAWRKDAEQTVEEIMATMFKPDLLILDDIGRMSGAPEEKETVSILVNGRMNRGKRTISTTNSVLTDEKGKAQFLAACDSRVLERYSGQDVDASKWGGTNLRRGK